MPADLLLLLQSPEVTKTGTFNSTGVKIRQTPRRGLYGRVVYRNASTSSGAGSITFRITESNDDSSYGGIFQTTESTITLSTTATSGVLYIPFETDRDYVRLELSAISGTGATVDYYGDIVLSRP